MSDEQAVIVCGSADDPYIVPGSTPDVCSNCGADVVVSPSGRTIIAEQHAEVLCGACGITLMATDEHPEVMPLTPEQLAEIKLALTRLL